MRQEQKRQKPDRDRGGKRWNPYDDQEAKPDYSAPKPLKPPPLRSCPNRWCPQGLYAEFQDTSGKTEGYCTGCGYERSRHEPAHSAGPSSEGLGPQPAAAA